VAKNSYSGSSYGDKFVRTLEPEVVMSDHAGSAVRFEILGPLRAWRGDVALSLGPVQQQVVLAVLLVHANRPLSRAQFVQAVWGDTAPTFAVNLLQKHVSALRRVLEPDRPGRATSGLLTWTKAGYLLTVPPDGLDLQRFHSHLDRGRAARAGGDLAAAGDAFRSALGLFRGPAFDGLTSDMLDAERERLAERRIDVREDRLEVDLALGRPHDAVVELRHLVADFPLRERLRSLLMLALYRSGRQSEALAAFQDARRLLHDELGIEPGPSLQRLHRQILNADPALGADQRGAEPSPAPAAPRQPVPAQLPHGMPDFAGRRPELDRLHGLLPADGAAGPVVITAIDGTAGVGKTALAIHFAHLIRDRFPDGQLYVNLRGFDPSGSVTEPGDAVRGFLDAFAVPPQQLPTGLDAQAALYRSLLAGKRVLVVLDNARDADQVRPLLPGAPGCLAIITSRNRLTSLVATEGAQPVTVGLLSVAESRQLLTRRIGPARVTGAPAAADEIIRLCARLPLAMAIVAARAVIQPRFPLTVLADQLRHARGALDAFTDGDQTSDVRAVLSWSYTALSAPAARLFRLIGLHRGPHLTSAAAASLAGTGPQQAGRALAELTRAHLIEEQAPGRYTFHDLLRAYATEQADGLETRTERAAAIDRVLDHYLHTAYGADRLLNPHRDPLTLRSPSPGVDGAQLTDHDQALAWFTAEHPVLLAALEQAVAVDSHARACQLAWALATFFDRRGHWHDLAAAQVAGLAAARRIADPAQQAHAHCSLARAYSQLGRYEDAHDHLRQALAVYAELGDRAGAAHADYALARVLYRQGRHGDALNHAERSLELYRAVDHRAGQAAALNAVGWFHSLLGDLQRALTYCEEALALHAGLNDGYGEAAAWDSLGYAHRHLGHYRQAVDCYRQAGGLWAELGDRYNEADTLGRLGDTQLAGDDVEAARSAWEQARVILAELHHPDVRRVQAKLDKITGTAAVVAA
jgi:DNA-binding SARP family transcriptional activator/predicted negative regulator of RcsB-dependent stress response